MTGVSQVIANRHLLGALREGFEGPQQEWAYFADAGPAAGLLGVIDAIDAAAASHATGPNDTTIAAHIHHLCFSLDASMAWLRGDRTSPDWRESWAVTTVDDDAWASLRWEFRNRYRELVRLIDDIDLSTEMEFGLTVGAIAHIAYHLGAIRQKIAPAAGD